MLLLAGVGVGCRSSISTESSIRDRSRDAVLVTSTRCDGTATGSGFQIDETHVVTNRHVVEGSRDLEVRGGSQTEAVLEVSVSTNTDLAVLRIANAVAPILQPGPEPKAGDVVWVIGHPRGGPVTSSSGRIVDYTTKLSDNGIDSVIRARATVDRGNSGGPMENRVGGVVGLVFAIDLNEGFAVAIPISRVGAALEHVQPIPLVDSC